MIRENSFEAIYTDIHIHTSERPDSIIKGVKYNLDELLKKIDSISGKAKKLISFSDHNVINKSVYLSEFPDLYYLLLGVELHVNYDKGKKPYHCHMIFNCEITEKNIDDINEKLNKLYPKKEITPEDYSKIPKLGDIINEFNSYEFIMLPHGGQSHSRFDMAIPKGTTFDDVMEKTLYYNQFDGFTSRSTKGKDRTIKYFKKLGIDEFTNLITCTDNYNPQKYPEAKEPTEEKFVPTWILAEPTFSGLRLSLSESNRLIYEDNPSKIYEEYIKKYEIKNDLLDINVLFQPGLNVIIGESSSGKSLLVDSLVKKLNGEIDKSVYKKNFDFSSLNIINESGIIPYYINQNYIMEVANKNKIEDISIIKKMFGPTEKSELQTKSKLNELNICLTEMINSVEKIEQLQENLKALPNLEMLVLYKINTINPIENLFPSDRIIEKISYNEDQFNKHIQNLDELLLFSKNNINIPDISSEIKSLKDKLSVGYKKSEFQKVIYKIIQKKYKYFNEKYKYEDAEIKTKNENFQKVKLYISEYLNELVNFDKKIKKLSQFSYTIKSSSIFVAGHELYVENNLKITEDTLVENINCFLKVNKKITSFTEIKPTDLFLNNLNGSFKIDNYGMFKDKIYSKFTGNNKYTYKIITSDKKKWEDLSPGWKTAILTELILKYDKDQAPLIIDQPEDNLANKYINTTLIKNIKDSKIKKQIIIVSHNATIPILADAENIIYCSSNGNNIFIRSNYMENNINGKPCLDIIADITDGGKKSIRKRFKKYNIKTYKEEQDEF